MKNLLHFVMLMGYVFLSQPLHAQVKRAPAYPLISHDPYFSIWSFTDSLNESNTRHWTGREQSLLAMAKVDNKIYRLMGKEPAQYNIIMGASDATDYSVKYLLADNLEATPPEGWMNGNFDDSSWKEAPCPFGNRGTKPKTLWPENEGAKSQLWVRRGFQMENAKILGELILRLFHDDDIEVFLNGDLIFSRERWNDELQNFPLGYRVKQKLKNGSNMMAIHIKNKWGGSWLDFGLLERVESIRYTYLAGASDVEDYSVKHKIVDNLDDASPAGWMNADFDDSSWGVAPCPFGNRGSTPKTFWPVVKEAKSQLWVRRSFQLDKAEVIGDLYLRLFHDDDIEVFLNGDLIFTRERWNESLEDFLLSNTDKQKLKKGNNLLAVHIKNNFGGSWLDFGLVLKLELFGKAKQKSLDLTATQTKYTFTCGGVDVDLSFVNPLLINDLNQLAKPVSYLSFKTKSNDSNSHSVSVFLGCSSDLSVNQPEQEVSATQSTFESLQMLSAGTKEQPILLKKGDDLRIDWGYVYVAVPTSSNAVQYISSTVSAETAFTPTESVTGGKSLWLNTIIPLTTGNQPSEATIMLAYDDIYSIQYFLQNLRPWWRRGAPSNAIEKELIYSNSNFTTLLKKCEETDTMIYNNARKAGGENYAKLCVMAYRQTISAHKLLKDANGNILFLSKENFSNGSIGTVDITYPSAPLFLAYNPELLKGMLNGIFYYCESSAWTKAFAAHDIGTYPLANGQTYGGDMPLEECGNMLCLAAAIARSEGKADYAKQHWNILTTWVNYLTENGLDPTNQLCTDDFAGHLARNANLAVKAICGVGAYGMLADMIGDKMTGTKYKDKAREMAAKWVTLADTGDHYALTYDDKNTWSQKYNLVWDKMLGLNLFPPEVYKKEVAWYLTKQNTFGLPLDNRKTYTKSDWITWTATLSEDRQTFEAFINPVYKFASETETRVPLTDWYETTNGKKEGFQAHSVVGGYFLKVLADKWKANPLPPSVTTDIPVDKGLAVYPIPAGNRLMVESQSTINRIQLHSIAGVELLSKEASSEKVDISLENLASGIYVLTATDKKGMHRMKVIKK